MASGDSTTSRDSTVPLPPNSTAEESVGSEVNLHIYHCDSATGFLNWAFLKSWDMGIYHAAIEVHGEEWSFQYFEDTWDDSSISGVLRCEPKTMPNFEYQETISLGRTQLNDDEVYRIINALYEEWPANSYHLTRRNCVHFAKQLAGLLGTTEPFPSWTSGAIDASANNPNTDAVVDYGWSWARWYMEYKHSTPDAESAQASSSTSCMFGAVHEA